MGTLLEVKDLRTRFFTQDGVVHAVNGVSFSLDEGETVGVVGESGCGKSVTMMSILRLIPIPPGKIAGGSAVYNGRDLTKISDAELRQVRGREIAMIFQDPMTSLNPVLTIGHQIREALKLHLGMSTEQANRRAVELLKLVNIPNAADRLNDYPHQFSGGMRQRVMIAMALSCNPSILIADEPTTALDVTISAQILDLVRSLREKLGMAIIWITHDLGVVAGLADRVLVMYAGYIIEKASVRELYGHPCHPYTVGLLGSLPRIDEREHRRLISIEGIPPDLLTEPTSCPFAPRCPYVVERCLQENPPLRPVGPEHEVACWYDIEERMRDMANGGKAR